MLGSNDLSCPLSLSVARAMTITPENRKLFEEWGCEKVRLDLHRCIDGGRLIVGRDNLIQAADWLSEQDRKHRRTSIWIGVLTFIAAAIAAVAAVPVIKHAVERIWQAEEQRHPPVNGSPVAENIRVGGQYVYHDRVGSVPDYKSHSGWTVTVTSVNLAADAESVTMYNVKASDGWEGSIYADELSPIP
jgi:hypothetical protein